MTYLTCFSHVLQFFISSLSHGTDYNARWIERGAYQSVSQKAISNQKAISQVFIIDQSLNYNSITKVTDVELICLKLHHIHK